MLYFLQFVYVKQTEGFLLFNEEFEAWPYGPLMREVYFKYSEFGGRPIEKVMEVHIQMSEALKSFIDAGIKNLRGQSPWNLVRLSHAPGSPWYQVYRGGEGNGCTISNEMIIRAATGTG